MMFCINTGYKIFRKNKNQDLLKLLSRPPNPEKLKGIQKLTEKNMYSDERCNQWTLLTYMR